MMALVTLALTGCDDRPLSGPPELRLGRDECAECGMLIDDDRSACAVLVDDRGLRSHLLFDDLGCLLDHEREGLDGRTVVERFARDYETRAWVPAELAHYIVAPSDELPTPMGSGLAAFAARDDAERAALARQGRVVDLSGLIRARLDWKEARRAARERQAPKTP